jgi:hypothetical protein
MLVASLASREGDGSEEKKNSEKEKRVLWAAVHDAGQPTYGGALGPQAGKARPD